MMTISSPLSPIHDFSDNLMAMQTPDKESSRPSQSEPRRTAISWILPAAVLGTMLACTAAGRDFLQSNMAPSVHPGDDFFTYANGGWLRRHPIPASEAGWGIGNVVREELYMRLRRINEEAAKSAAASGDTRMIGNFWRTAMDTKKALRLGLDPLRAELQRINATQTVQDVIDVAFAMQPIGVDCFFSFSVSQDEKKSDVMSVHVAQGGLGLPERDFYFNEETGVAKIRQEYVGHVARVLKLLGRPETETRSAATEFMAFETALARASRKLEDLRDAVRNYNQLSPGELTKKHTPGITWTDRLKVWKLGTDEIIVGPAGILQRAGRSV